MIFLNYYNELLKQKFLKTGFVLEEDLNKYSLRNQNKNFYEEMTSKTIEEYEDGDGKELTDGKMRMIRSSSAMIYNILGNENVVIKGNEIIPAGNYYKKFEKKYKTINGKHPETGKQIEANLDAWLYNETSEIFIESKCLEWLENKHEKELRRSYLYSNSKYFYQDSAEIFRDIAHDLSLSQYDSCQMYKHTLAIYNYLKDNNINGKKILLMNVVWEPDVKELPVNIQKVYESQLLLEHEEFNYFHKLMEPIIQIIAEETKNDFNILYLSVKDFCSLIDYQNKNQQNFISRYL